MVATELPGRPSPNASCGGRSLEVWAALRRRRATRPGRAADPRRHQLATWTSVDSPTGRLTNLTPV